jgi:hypothetical protein
MASTLTMMIDREDYHSEPLLLEIHLQNSFILEKHFKMDTLPSQSSSTGTTSAFTTFVGPSNTMAWLESFLDGVNDLIVVQHDGRQQVRGGAVVWRRI